MKKALLSIFAILVFASFVNAQVPARVGWWKFDDAADMLKAQIGSPLVLTGTQTSVPGPLAGNLATQVPKASYLTMTHGIAANGGGDSVNVYSVQIDFSVPAIGIWHSFIQTNPSNTGGGSKGDADLFTNTTNHIGTAATGYSANTIVADKWYRMVISVTNGEFFRVYLDGELWLESTTQVVDGRWALVNELLIFADDDGDDGIINCSELGIWDVALTAAQVSTLGNVYPPVLLTGSAFGGWDEAGRIKLATADGITYTATNIEILGDGAGTSEFKFTEGTWATAAGPAVAPGFPTGVASNTAGGAPNMVGVPGFWNVTFDYPTKAYEFTPGVNPNRAVNFEGTAYPAGAALSTTDGIKYSKESVTLSAGTGQFVEKASEINPTPTANWSSADFPTGTGTQGGALIASMPGTYYINFDITTGAYDFMPTVVSIIGDFNNWGGDVELTTTDNITWQISGQIFNTAGTLKFRDNHNWNFNYGSETGVEFPSGTGVSNSAKNIPYTAGKYDITFNRTTLVYTFTQQPFTAEDFNIIKDGGFATDGPIASPWAFWSGNGGAASVVSGVCVMVPAAKSDSWQLQVNQTGNDVGWSVANGDSYVFMFDAMADSARAFNIDFEDPTNGYKRFGLSSASDAVNGESEWFVALSTDMTTYTRDVTFNAVKANTKFLLNIMPGSAIKPVHIDNIMLIKASDIQKFGILVTALSVKGEGDATTIETSLGTLQMIADVLPVDATLQGVTWSVVNGTGSATINSKGLLTAIGDGTVTVTATAKDGSGISASMEVTIAQPVGISDKSASLVKVYPNPAQNDLYITGKPTLSKVVVYTVLGTQVKEYSNVLQSISISDLKTGVYIIKLTDTNGKTVTSKFIKK